MPILPRFGNNWCIDSAFNKLSYYGRGPIENYSDRKSSTLIGLYNSTVDQQFFPYIRPQDTGNKTDCRWFSLSNDQGIGLLFVGDSILNCSVLPYSQQSLDPGIEKTQSKSTDLIKSNSNYVNIDYGQMGVGGIDSWYSWPLSQYQIKPITLQYSYYLIPFDATKSTPQKIYYKLISGK